MTVRVLDNDTLNRLLDQAPGHLLFTDLDMKVRYVNRAWNGFELEKVVGNSYFDFLSPEQRPQVETAFRKALETGEGQDTEIVIETAGGRICQLMQISPMRDESGTVLGFINVTTDVSEQRQAERALAETRKELLDASHRAGMAEVATGVLHSIGTVLSSLTVTASVADQQLQKSPISLLGETIGKLERPPSELATFLREDAQGVELPRVLCGITDELLQEREKLLSEVKRVKQQVELMQTTIAAQQAFAKADLFVQEIELGTLINRVVSIFRIEIDGRKIDLTTDIRPALVTLDTQSTLQILANLVRNSIEAMEASQPRKLAISAGVEDGRVIIAVEDTGCGIEEAVKARMFQHGFTTRANGHGFGLHVAATAAQTMGGTLTGHSDGPGRGARFRLDLPDRRAADGQQSSK